MKKTVCLLLCCLLFLCGVSLAEGGTPDYLTVGSVIEAHMEGSLLTLSTPDGVTATLPVEEGYSFIPGAYDGSYSGSVISSRDGRRALIFIRSEEDAMSRNRLYLFDGAAITPVCDGAGTRLARLSNDGATVIYCTGDKLLYAWDAASGQSFYIAEDFVNERYCGFTADGDKVFYTRMSWTAAGAPALVGCLYDCASHTEEAVLEGGVLLSVSADDNCLLYFTVDLEEEDITGVSILNRESGAVCELAADDDVTVYSNLNQDEFLAVTDDAAVLSLRGGEAVQIAVDDTWPLLPYATAQDIVSGVRVLGVSTLRGMYFVNETPDGLYRVIRIAEDGTAQNVMQGIEDKTAFLLTDGHTLIALKNGGIRRVDGLNPSGPPEIIVSGGVLECVPAADGRAVFYVKEGEGYSASLYVATTGGQPKLLIPDMETRWIGSRSYNYIYGGD
ncbi:MAG: hypothetical protein J5998_02650, partial [Clostridia bacterium]|nr:hypothetical protein [Clostridia bacterium]